jgi:hypothetical protein
MSRKKSTNKKVSIKSDTDGLVGQLDDLKVFVADDDGVKDAISVIKRFVQKNELVIDMNLGINQKVSEVYHFEEIFGFADVVKTPETFSEGFSKSLEMMSFFIKLAANSNLSEPEINYIKETISNVVDTSFSAPTQKNQFDGTIIKKSQIDDCGPLSEAVIMLEKIDNASIVETMCESRETLITKKNALEINLNHYTNLVNTYDPNETVDIKNKIEYIESKKEEFKATGAVDKELEDSFHFAIDGDEITYLEKMDCMLASHKNNLVYSSEKHDNDKLNLQLTIDKLEDVKRKINDFDNMNPETRELFTRATKGLPLISKLVANQ